MDTLSIENLKIVRTSNKEMLDYFNSLYVQNLEHVQKLKTEQFELKAKIDELERTRNVYSFKNSTGQNVFSPFSTENTFNQEKAMRIEKQLHDLIDVQSSINEKISMLEEEIDDFKSKINTLNISNKKLDILLFEAEDELQKELEKKLEEENAAEDDISVEGDYEEDEEEETQTEPDINHGLNILMLQDYDKKQIADKLETQIAEILDSNLHKMEILSWVLKSDVERAQVTLNELVTSNENLLNNVDKMINTLSCNINTSEPVWTLLEDIMLEYKEAHPECVIDSEIECPDYDLNLPVIITSNLVTIIREIMDNSFQHSNANRIIAKIYISKKLIDVSINDNGVGIDSNFNHITPWYSGLHRIREIIYLLGGQFKIDGDIISGTNVKFSFLVDED